MRTVKFSELKETVERDRREVVAYWVEVDPLPKNNLLYTQGDGETVQLWAVLYEEQIDRWCRKLRTPREDVVATEIPDPYCGRFAVRDDKLDALLGIIRKNKLKGRYRRCGTDEWEEI